MICDLKCKKLFALCHMEWKFQIVKRTGVLKLVYTFGGVIILEMPKLHNSVINKLNLPEIPKGFGARKWKQKNKSQNKANFLKQFFLCSVSLLCAIEISFKDSKSVKIPRIDCKAAHVCPLIKMASFRKAQAPLRPSNFLSSRNCFFLQNN